MLCSTTMSTRNPTAPTPVRADWVVATDDVHLDGHRQRLSPGVELTVHRRSNGGRRMRVQFRRHVTHADGTVHLDVFDGRMVRSFTPADVVTIHRPRKVTP